MSSALSWTSLLFRMSPGSLFHSVRAALYRMYHHTSCSLLLGQKANLCYSVLNFCLICIYEYTLPFYHISIHEYLLYSLIAFYSKSFCQNNLCEQAHLCPHTNDSLILRYCLKRTWSPRLTTLILIDSRGIFSS